MPWYTLEAWVSNIDREIYHTVAFMLSQHPEYSGANWRIIETGFSLVHAMGTVNIDGDWILSSASSFWEHSTKTFTTTYNYDGYVELQIDSLPICWALTYSLKNGRKISMHGPGRYPSVINIQKDSNPDSYLLIEDGIVINRNKYKIIEE